MYNILPVNNVTYEKTGTIINQKMLIPIKKDKYKQEMRNKNSNMSNLDSYKRHTKGEHPVAIDEYIISAILVANRVAHG